MERVELLKFSITLYIMVFYETLRREKTGSNSVFPDYEPGGREFESLRARQVIKGLHRYCKPFFVFPR
jgi:hypothetical protein